MSGAMIEGDLSFARMPALLAQADALLGGAPRVSLARVTRADSAGLAFLLELTRRSAARGIELKFADAPSQIRDLAHFFGLDPVLALEA